MRVISHSWLTEYVVGLLHSKYPLKRLHQMNDRDIRGAPNRSIISGLDSTTSPQKLVSITWDQVIRFNFRDAFHRQNKPL